MIQYNWFVVAKSGLNQLLMHFVKAILLNIINLNSHIICVHAYNRYGMNEAAAIKRIAHLRRFSRFNYTVTL